MTDFRTCCILSILLLFTLSACTSQAEEPTAERVEVSLEEEMVIDGGDGLDDEEPFLGSVSRVATDPQGNQFLYDSQSVQFVKYDAQGNYITSFGREGSGPGEVQSVSAMYADSRGRLIISDAGNARITVYGSEGDFLLNEPQHGIQRIRDFSELDDGRFLVAGWHPERERMLHIMNGDFSEIEASMVREEMITDQEEENLRSLVRSLAGSAEMLDDGRILFAPDVYAAELYLFEENGDSWALTDTVWGWSATENPLRSTSGSNSIMERYPVSSILSMGFSDDNLTIVHLMSFSHGLYRTEDGSLIHLSYHFSEEEEAFRMVFEQFDPETVSLSRFGTIPLEMNTPLRPEWVDGAGALYLTNRDSVGLRKVRLEGLYP